VSKEETAAEAQAEARTEETREFVRRVRRVTRRKFTPEEKVRIVLEGFRGEVAVSDLCRREGIRSNVYYAWLKDFMEAGKTRLRADSVRDATQAEVEGLRRDNERLKQLVAELSLDVMVLKKTALPGLR
jgi:transposase